MATGLAGAVRLFALPKKPQQTKTQEQTNIETEKAVEDDMMALMSMKLSSTKAH
jgi:hypothetical protein